MSILAEEVVEEWLNRKGYFTIRGIKLGVDEIDLLAIRALRNGQLDRRHIEVQVSVRPVSYICRVPKAVQKSTGRAPNSAKRSAEDLVQGVAEWVEKKFAKERKVSIMQALAPGEWAKELVIHNVRAEEEVRLIRAHGIVIHRLRDVVDELRKAESLVPSASGGDLLELIHVSSAVREADAPAAEADIIARG
jgi:hypothetical protein